MLKSGVPDKTMYLDSDIRNWILIPVMLMMILVGVLTHFINALIHPSGVSTLKSQRERTALKRSALLRAGSKFLPETSVDSRRNFLTRKFKEGEYLKIKKDPNTVINPIDDPAIITNMKDMLTKYMASIAPQTVVMISINLFFSGLIIVKLPFPLTTHYKDMLQRGIETRDLDATWVSNLSWYFLNLFGLKSLYNLILDTDANTGGLADVADAPAAVGKAQDMENIFKREVEYLDLMRPHKPMIGLEERVIKLYE